MKNEKMRQEQTGSVCKLAQNNLRKIDTEAIKLHIRGILQALGDDPDREGLKETPERVAKMYEEVFEGMCYSNQEIADMFRKNFAQDSTENSQDMVLVKNIEIFSYCEHHLALMYDMKVSVAYIPRGNVLGLSKIARIADMVGKRLQLQERIGSDIAVDAADIVLVDDDIKELPHLISLSKRMMMTIKCNLIFSLSLNFLAILLAITGVLNPVVGALVHNAGSVVVIINSAFLLRWKQHKK